MLRRAATDADRGKYAYMPPPLLSGGSIGGGGEVLSTELALLPSAARFASHLAFIAAESWARRSGERFSFFLGFLALPG